MDRLLLTSVLLLLTLAVAPAAGASAPPAPPGCGAATITSHANTTATGIPNGPGEVTSTIEVAGAGPYLTDVDLITNITHQFAADLDITLQSPAGTVTTLTTDNGDGNDNVFAGTTFDDQANPGGQVPYTVNNGVTTEHQFANNQVATPLVPEEALGAFNGENPNGTWTLTVRDDLAGDEGTLQSWSLDIQSLSSAPRASATAHASTATTAIPGGPAVVTSTIEVAGADAHLTDVNLLTNLMHTFPADLDVTLESPAGTVTTLTTDNGVGRDHVFAGTTFDDQANPGGQVPYVTNNGVATEHNYVINQVATPLVPEEALAVFNGENPNGTWTLTVSDDQAGDGGQVDWSLDLTTGACAPPPEPPPVQAPPATAPATGGGSAPQPSSATLQVTAARLSVFAPTAGARCLGADGACRVRMLVGRQLIARGTANAENVPLRLTRSGRKLLTRRFGGARASVVATDTARRATTRTRAILAVERITTPPGSWVPDRAELTAVGRRFVRSLRARMVGVTGLRCDGHVARGEGGRALSRARARVVCGKEARLVAHGAGDPIASNATETGRARNRRVEITVRHTKR